ncbi:MAG TPA: energy-coupling factor transporter transmembrane component T [Actinomycetes bacterium]|nr:energy-coupling factor transporter transmembrane component T [Actinomycetes bacterium]
MSHAPRPARYLHPVAWWMWALALAAAASRTLNPILLAGIIAVAWLVVAARRADTPWARSFRAFMILGAFVLVVRVVFEVLFGAPLPGTTILTLPEVTMPEWMAGVRLGGEVTLEALVAALYSGLQLVAILACVGAANSLANPTRLLKSVPGALYEIGVSIVVALTLVPAALEHLQQVRDARRLRGRATRGLRANGRIGGAVLTGALERSLALAAAMDSRGFGRLRPLSRAERRITASLMLLGLLAAIVGGYALLDASTSPRVATATLVVGLTLLVVGLIRANRRAVRTVYRPDPWRWPETATVAAGVLALVAFTVAAWVDPVAMLPSTWPLTWPALPLWPFAAILVAATPAWLTPPVPRPMKDAAESVDKPSPGLPVRMAA